MSEKIKCSKCQQNFNPRLYIKKHQTSQIRRKYCFECVPYLSGLSRDESVLLYGKDNRQCCNCKRILSISNFCNNGNGLNTYCNDCHNKIGAFKKYRLKKMYIDYKGGCCQKCGYKDCIAAMEFHHLDPSIKTKKISAYTGSAFRQEAKDELDKCILLCANCHRTVEFEDTLKSYRERPSVDKYVQLDWLDNYQITMD